MVEWYWVLVGLIVGIIIGIFFFSFMEISRSEDNRTRKWWEDE